MESLKERLSVKGAKCNLQFSTREREFYEREAGFTDEEIEIFRMRSRGWSIIKNCTRDVQQARQVLQYKHN